MLRSILLATALATAAAVAWYLGHPGSAVVAATAAAGLLLLAVPATRPPQAGGASLDSIATALHLDGRGIHAPSPKGIRLFVPGESSGGTTPVLGGDDVHRAVVGLEVTPPGQGFFDAWGRLHGAPRGQGIEEAALHVKRAFPAMQLGAARITRNEDHLRIHLADPAPQHGHALAFGDARTSLAAMLIVAATRRPVQYVDWQDAQHGSILEVRLL